MNTFEALKKHNVPFIVTSTANIFGGGNRYQYHLHIHEDDINKIELVKKETISVTKNEINWGYLKREMPFEDGITESAFRTERYLNFKHSHFNELLTIPVDNYLLLHFRESKSDFKPTLKEGSDVVYNYMLADFGKYYKSKREDKMKIELINIKKGIAESFISHTLDAKKVCTIIDTIDSMLSEKLYSKSDIREALRGVDITSSELENKLSLI